MSAAAIPNNTMSGPCSFSMTPVPLGIAMPLATANPVHCLAENCSRTLMPQQGQEKRYVSIQKCRVQATKNVMRRPVMGALKDPT